MIEGHSHDPTRYNNPTKGLQYDITSGEVSHDTIVMANLVRMTEFEILPLYRLRYHV